MFSAELKARQAGTRIVRSAPIAQNVPAPREQITGIYAGLFQKKNFWHIAGGGKGMQLLPFLNSNKKIPIKGGTAWLRNQIY